MASDIVEYRGELFVTEATPFGSSVHRITEYERGVIFKGCNPHKACPAAAKAIKALLKKETGE